MGAKPPPFLHRRSRSKFFPKGLFAGQAGARAWANRTAYEVTSFANLLRGGSWNLSDDYVRSAYRNLSYPGDWYVYFGFRCVRSQ